MNETWLTTHGDRVHLMARYGLRGKRWYFTVTTAGNHKIAEWGEAYVRRVDAVAAAERHHPRVGEFE